jgi:hypothetical protein
MQCLWPSLYWNKKDEQGLSTTIIYNNTKQEVSINLNQFRTDYNLFWECKLWKLILFIICGHNENSLQYCVYFKSLTLKSVSHDYNNCL